MDGDTQELRRLIRHLVAEVQETSPRVADQLIDSDEVDDKKTGERGTDNRARGLKKLDDNGKEVREMSGAGAVAGFTAPLGAEPKTFGAPPMASKKKKSSRQ